jgi:hypothetical protein
MGSSKQVKEEGHQEGDDKKYSESKGDDAAAEGSVDTEALPPSFASSSASSQDDDADSTEIMTAFPNMPLLKYGRLIGSLPRQALHYQASTREEEGRPKANGSDQKAFDNTDVASSNRGVHSRPLSKKCTACILGRVTASPFSDLPQDKLDVLALGFVDGAIHLVDARTGLDICPPQYLCMDPHHKKLHPSQQNDKRSKAFASTKDHNLNSISALSMDASGNTLAACQSNGAVAVWDFKWASTESDISNSATTKMYTTTSASQKDHNNHTHNLKNSTAVSCLLRSGPHLMSFPSTPFRFSYGPGSTLSCMVVDPAYSRLHPRSTEGKQLLAGFSDGRLVLTKRNFGFVAPASASSSSTSNPAAEDGSSFLGGLWSGLGTMIKKAPTTDDVVYQSPHTSDRIEVVTWRGNLVAWADSTGIKLMDTDTWTRLAHIDQPVGARASLYQPYVTGIRCSLVWESSSSLLVAWGDCLMNLQVREHTGPPIQLQPNAQTRQTSDADKNRDERTSNSGTSLPLPPDKGSTTAADTAAPPSIIRKRTVECAMAWELDCVACGVAPMDADHVAVLGIVVPESPSFKAEDTSNGVRVEGADFQEKEESKQDQEQVDPGIATQNNIAHPVVELQLISRKEGTMALSNGIPLLFPDSGGDNSGTHESHALHPPSVVASEMSLLSTYSTARVDARTEAAESLELQNNGVTDLPAFPYSPSASPLAGTVGNNTHTNCNSSPVADMYRHWSLDCVLCQPDAFYHPHLRQKKLLEVQQIDKAKNTVFSSKDTIKDNHSRRPMPQVLLPLPPTMVICSQFDVMVAVTRDVDDAIAHSRSHGNSKLALMRGWWNTPLAKIVSLDVLVNEYLTSLLKLRTVQSMTMAAKSMDVLLRGNVDLWGKWICVFSKLQGGLFALREHIPIRGELLLLCYFFIKFTSMPKRAVTCFLMANFYYIYIL